MSDDASRRFDELLADAVHEPPLLIPGTKLAEGRFLVRALLGTGGMGAVYRATDSQRGLDIALKVLSRVEPAGIYRLKQEFRTLSDVHHPGLVTLHELHEDRGTWFLTMDLVSGRPLSRVRWTEPLLRRVFGELAEAVHAIHAQGKLHRDLKPSNIMLDVSGRVVVLDFGLAGDWTPEGARATIADDGRAGTPAYMAPEQVTGRATPQSDWYAFGTMLYEALCGGLPFAGSGVAVLALKLTQPAPPPPAGGVEVPPDLLDLCMRLLDQDAARRPGHAEIVAVLGAAGQAPTSVDDRALDPFVGREAELRALEQALLETAKGQGAVVAISGSPGVGKTRLVSHFLQHVRTDLGGVALCGSCPRWEHIPFRACDSLIDDLSQYLRGLPAERAATLLPRATHALAQIFPVLAGIPAARSIAGRRDLPREPSEIRRLGLGALRELLGNLAIGQRLVLFVDDLQWSDLDGARLLASLVTQPAPSDAPPVLLIVAHRPLETELAPPGLAFFLERVAANRDLFVRHLRLPELGASESRELTRRLLEGRSDGLEDRIVGDAGGNPLFIRQLCRRGPVRVPAEGPLDLDTVIAGRVATLSPRERSTLAAICLTPRPISLGLLSRITDQPDMEAQVRDLERAQLARFAAGPAEAVAAFHDRVREVVLSSLAPGQRLSLHARSVEALEDTADPDLAALTLHYVGSGRDRDAAACAVKAAEHAASLLAFEQAAAMYRLALDLGRWNARERAALCVRRAEALANDHRSGEAGRQLLDAASLETGAADRRALRLRAADQYLAGGWLREGIGLLHEALADVGLDYDAIYRADPVALRRRLAERGYALSPRPGHPIEPQTLARLDALLVASNGLAFLLPQSVQFRFALALEALDAGAPLHAAYGLGGVAHFDAQLSPDGDEVDRVVLRLCRENPGIQADLILPTLEAGSALVRGRPWEQVEAGRRTEELLLRHPVQGARLLAVARYHQAFGLFSQGEVHELHRCWDWLEDASHRNDLFLVSWLDVLLATQCIAGGRPEVARDMCLKASRLRAAAAGMQESALTFGCAEVLGACAIYEGRASAWDELKAATRWLDGSTLGHMPFVVCHCHCAWARAALACAQLVRPDHAGREAWLREAESSLATVAGLRGSDGRTFVLPHYRNLATLLGAGLAAARGDLESARLRLDLGLEQLAAAGSYSLLSAHARRARGLLLGGTAGAALAARAEAELRRLGVADPARHARTVLPGFPG